MHLLEEVISIHPILTSFCLSIRNPTHVFFLHAMLLQDYQGKAMYGCMLYSRSKLQPRNGSPMYPTTQVHTGLWFMTLHSALNPQTPGQGSIQCWLTQARVVIQSELTTHSGLHPLYGSPKYSGLQLQMH